MSFKNLLNRISNGRPKLFSSSISMQRLDEDFFSNDVLPPFNANSSTRITSFPTLSSETDYSDERSKQNKNQNLLRISIIIAATCVGTIFFIFMLYFIGNYIAGSSSSSNSIKSEQSNQNSTSKTTSTKMFYVYTNLVINFKSFQVPRHLLAEPYNCSQLMFDFSKSCSDNDLYQCQNLSSSLNNLILTGIDFLLDSNSLNSTLIENLNSLNLSDISNTNLANKAIVTCDLGFCFEYIDKLPSILLNNVTNSNLPALNMVNQNLSFLLNPCQWYNVTILSTQITSEMNEKTTTINYDYFTTEDFLDY